MSSPARSRFDLVGVKIQKTDLQGFKNLVGLLYYS